jgi:WhiB family redox-sensing transcriptional regulator
MMTPIQWRDATVGGQDSTGLSLVLPCTEDPELFFAESPQDVEQAKAMCRGCRARLACLASALERKEPWGVWGGELLLSGAIMPRKRPRGRPRKEAVLAGLLPAGLLPPLAGLVVAGGLLGDDVHAVPGVDTSDEAHQSCELVLVVVLGGIRPCLVGHPAGGVGEAGALLG